MHPPPLIQPVPQLASAWIQALDPRARRIALALPRPITARIVVTAVVLTGCLGVLYLSAGVALHLTPNRPMLVREVLFETDIPRITGDMTDPNFPHHRTNIHPIFVLLTNPLGATLSTLLGHRHTVAAIALSSLFGALAAFLSFWLFWMMSGGQLLRTALMTLIGGVSMSRLFFSAVPETYALAGLTLAATYLVFWVDLYVRRMPLAVWAMAGSLCFGVTVTNFAQTVVCFAIANHARARQSFTRTGLSTSAYAALVIVTVVLLNVVQNILYPSTVSQSTASALTGEMRYVSFEILRAPAPVAAELLTNVALVNVIGGLPAQVQGEWSLPRLTFGGSWKWSAVGFLAIAMWIALICWSGGRSRIAKHHLFYAGLTLCLIFNLVLHSVFFERMVVIEYFIYSGNFTMAVMVLALGPLLHTRRVPTWMLASFFGLLAVNNIDVMRRIASFYD